MSGPIKDFQSDLSTPYLLADTTQTDEADVVFLPGQQVWILAHDPRNKITMVEVDGNDDVYWIDGDTIVSPLEEP